MKRLIVGISSVALIVTFVFGGTAQAQRKHWTDKIIDNTWQQGGGKKATPRDDSNQSVPRKKKKKRSE